MVGSAVSSSTPRDFQPSSHIGQRGSRPLMNGHAFSPGPTQGCPYIAVGMQRALDSLIGLPSRSTSASWMLAFLMPADVRRSFKLTPEFVDVGGDVLGAYSGRDWQASENSSVPARSSVTSSGDSPEHRRRS